MTGPGILWARLATPLGEFLSAESEEGCISVGLHPRDVEGFHGEILTILPAARFREVAPEDLVSARQIQEYARSRRKTFDLPLHWSGTPLRQLVWRKLLEVPFGATSTYGELARAVGRPRAARAVGGAMAANPLPILVPCHRVLASGGRLGGFGGGLALKQRLLRHEGALLPLG